MPSQCSINANECYDDNDKKTLFLNLLRCIEVKIGLHSSCSVEDAQKFEIKEGHEDCKNLDWNAENEIGCCKPDD